MTDEEFERLKEAEKEHLRAKKRLRATLEAMKRRRGSEGVVERMKRGAERLLDETESLVDALRRTVARRTGRLEVALDDPDDAGLDEAEQALREERAEALLRQYKAARSSASRPDDGDDAPASEAPGSEAPPTDGPEKTIGRMRTPRSDDDAS